MRSTRRRRAGRKCWSWCAGRCRAPGPGEVLIRVAAAGVNRPDVLQRRGLYPPPPGAPSIPGLEVAGEVVAAGEGVPDELIGQPVCALIAGGGYAEYAVAPVGQCLPVPRGADAWSRRRRCRRRCSPSGPTCSSAPMRREGETVLVHGGTSGIGTMAIALGRAVRRSGSSSPAAATRNAARAEALGAAARDQLPRRRISSRR